MAKYSDIVMGDVRQNLGLDDPEDTSLDSRIDAMPRREVFTRFLEWNGIIGYGSVIRDAIENIYDMKLEEKKEQPK